MYDRTAPALPLLRMEAAARGALDVTAEDAEALSKLPLARVRDAMCEVYGLGGVPGGKNYSPRTLTQSEQSGLVFIFDVSTMPDRLAVCRCILDKVGISERRMERRRRW